MTYHAKVISGGKIVIPAELRRELAIRDGDSLVIERGGDGALILKTYAQVVREVQAQVRALMPASTPSRVVDDLLAERSGAAARENAELDGWAQERQH